MYKIMNISAMIAITTTIRTITEMMITKAIIVSQFSKYGNTIGSLK